MQHFYPLLSFREKFLTYKDLICTENFPGIMNYLVIVPVLDAVPISYLGKGEWWDSGDRTAGAARAREQR
jgi:hypothetical protein